MSSRRRCHFLSILTLRSRLNAKSLKSTLLQVSNVLFSPSVPPCARYRAAPFVLTRCSPLRFLHSRILSSLLFYRSILVTCLLCRALRFQMLSMVYRIVCIIHYNEINLSQNPASSATYFLQSSTHLVPHPTTVAYFSRSRVHLPRVPSDPWNVLRDSMTDSRPPNHRMASARQLATITNHIQGDTGLVSSQVKRSARSPKIAA